MLDNNDIMLSLLRTSLCHCTKDIAGPDTAANWLVEGQDTPTLRIYAGESRDITDSRKLAYLLQIADEFNLPSDVDQDRRWSLIRISLATGLRNDAYMSELAPLIRDFAVEHTHDAWISTLETFILLNGLSDELPASDLLHCYPMKPVLSCLVQQANRGLWAPHSERDTLPDPLFICRLRL